MGCYVSSYVSSYVSFSCLFQGGIPLNRSEPFRNLYMGCYVSSYVGFSCLFQGGIPLNRSEPFRGEAKTAKNHVRNHVRNQAKNKTIREPECPCHPHPPSLPLDPLRHPSPFFPPRTPFGTVPQRPCHRVLARTWAETAGEHTPGPQTPTVKREPFAPHGIRENSPWKGLDRSGSLPVCHGLNQWPLTTCALP